MNDHKRGPNVIRNGKMLATKLPGEIADAVFRAAELDYVSPSEWVRRTIIARLRAEGLLPPREKHVDERDPVLDLTSD